jgi:CubicO group peptidase (beta-lactamase class C family)
MWPTRSWSTAAPETQGVDSEALAEMVEELSRGDTGAHSVLIVHHGVLVLEASFYPYDGETPHDVASVTKSVTTTLLGAAIADHRLGSLDRTLVSAIGADVDSLENPAFAEITLGELAAMRSGLDCGLSAGEPELIAMMQSDDWVRYALSLRQAHPPGTRFAYCSPGMHLLSAAISHLTGQSEAAFARRVLFGPLGIEPGPWPVDPAGYNHGWGDLRLRPRDMARIGLLYLHDGVWDGMRLLPKGWVADALRSRGETSPGGDGYGLGWWRPVGELEGAFEARGRGGQRIVVVPRLDLIVVTTGAGFDPRRIVPFVRGAIGDRDPLPPNPSAQARLNSAVAAARRAPPAVEPATPPAMAARIRGRRFVFEPNPLGFEALSLRPSGSDALALDLGLSGAMSAGTAGRYELLIGLDGRYRVTPHGPRDYAVAVRGAWSDASNLEVDYTEPAGSNRFDLVFRFEGDRLEAVVTDRTGLYGTHTLTARMVN